MTKIYISGLLLFSLMLNTLTIIAQDDDSVRILSDDSLLLVSSAAVFFNSIDTYTSENGTYVGIVGGLANLSQDRECAQMSDVFLEIDGVRYSPISKVMAALYKQMETKIDYIGSGGHCVASGESVGTFVIFDVPMEANEILMGFQNDRERLIVNWMGSESEEIQPYTGIEHGLNAEYFTTKSLVSKSYNRVDLNINFDWSFNSPHHQLDSDNFSIRWTGWIKPLYDEQYTFFVRSDDGVQLWIDNKRIIADWNAHSVEMNQETIELQANELYEIRLEYFESTGNAEIQLLWESRSQSLQVVPSSQLFPDVDQNELPIPTATNTTVEVPTVTPMPSATPQPTNTPLPSGVISSNQNVNIRSSGSTTASIVTVLSQGSQVTILGQNDTGDWLNVRTDDGVEGWIASFLIQTVTYSSIKPTEEKVVTPASDVVCNPNMNSLGGAFRLVNSYVNNGDYDIDFANYSYDVSNRTSYGDYGLFVSVGTDWNWSVFSITANEVKKYVGVETIQGIEVTYGYDGILGDYEGLFFSFEHGGLKYSGDVALYGENASQSIRNILYDDLIFFILIIKQC